MPAIGVFSLLISAFRNSYWLNPQGVNIIYSIYSNIINSEQSAPRCLTDLYEHTCVQSLRCESLMPRVGVLQAAPAAKRFNTESATAAATSPAPDLPLSSSFPPSVEEDLSTEPLSCVYVRSPPRCCISAQSVCGEPPTPSMWPRCAAHSVSSLTAQDTSNSLSLSAPTLLLRVDDWGKTCEDFTPNTLSRTSW